MYPYNFKFFTRYEISFILKMYIKGGYAMSLDNDKYKKALEWRNKVLHGADALLEAYFYGMNTCVGHFDPYLIFFNVYVLEWIEIMMVMIHVHGMLRFLLRRQALLTIRRRRCWCRFKYSRYIRQIKHIFFLILNLFCYKMP